MTESFLIFIAEESARLMAVYYGLMIELNHVQELQRLEGNMPFILDGNIEDWSVGEGEND